MKLILDNVGVTAKYVVSGIAAASLLLNQSPVPLYYTVCALLNSLFGKIMKRIIKDHRPAKSPKPGYGMPSSHTTAISYFSFVVLYTAPYFVPQPALRLLLAVVVVAYGISACYWRIATHLHTPLQILLGACLGLCSGYLATSQEARMQAYTAAHPWPASSLFAVKLLVCLAIVPVVFKHEIRWLLRLFTSGGGGGGGSKTA